MYACLPLMLSQLCFIHKLCRDPDGFLALSAKQKALLAGWKRASELVDITMIRKVNPSSIVQVGTYERNFRKEHDAIALV